MDERPPASRPWQGGRDDRIVGGIEVRVLFIGAHVGKGGGLALQTFQLFELLRSRIDVQLLCLDAPGLHRPLADRPGVMVAGPLSFPGGIGLLRRALRSLHNDFDVFQTLDPYFSISASYLAHVSPRIIHLGTDPRAEIGWRYGFPAGLAARAIYPALLSGAVLVANSHALADRFPHRTPHVIPNGIALRKLERLPNQADAARSLGLPDGRPLLAFVGKVIPVKRVEWVLEVVRALPETAAVVVGDYAEEHYGDAYYRHLLATYADVRDRVVFSGEVVWDTVPRYLAAADVFVFPSKFEGQPNAVLEAMAAGLPVVASDIPPHRELINPGKTGFLSKDSASMASQVSELIRDDRLRRQIGAAGRAYVRERFSTDACASAYLALYESILRDGPDRPGASRG